MDDTKLEELEKACKKEKSHKVQTRMIAVRMIRVRNMSVDDTVDIQGRSPNLVHSWLRRYEGELEGLQNLPRCGRSRRITRGVMEDIITNVTGYPMTPILQRVSENAQGTMSAAIACARV